MLFSRYSSNHQVDYFYKKQICEVFKKAGGKWDPKLGVWRVTKSENILEKIKNIGLEVKKVESTEYFPTRKPKKIKVFA